MQGRGSVTGGRGSVRRQVRIGAPPERVWELVGDAGRIAEWFPGVVACRVEGSTRIVTTGSGIDMPEEIVTCDRLQRRFQYRIATPVLHEHLATIDVIDEGDGSSLVLYAVDADPATMALVLGGAAGRGLENVRARLEGGS